MSGIKGRLAKGSLWISAARGLTNAFSALSTIVLARLLVPADFGLVALATSMLTILTAFTDLSLSQALVQTRDPTPDHYNTVWSLGVARGLLLALAFAVGAPLAASAYHEPRLGGIMYALAFSAALGGLQNPKLIMLQKQLLFHQTFFLGVSSTLLNVATSITVALIFRSYWALVAGLLVGQVATVVISYTLFPFRPNLRWTHFRELWRFSVWVSLGQIVNTLNYRLDQLLVGTYLGRTQLGLYTVGSRLAVLPGQEIVRPLTSTLFPAFSLVADDPERLRRAYHRVQGLVTAIALPASLGFAVIADPVVRLALGDKWIAAIPIVQLIATLYSLDTLGSLVTPLGMAKGETRALFIRNCQKLAIRMPLMIAGMYLGGLLGLLYLRMLAGAIGVVIDMTMIKRMTGLDVLAQFRANTRCFLSVGAMIASTLLLKVLLPAPIGKLEIALMLAATVVAAASTYVASSWIFWRVAGSPPGHETDVLDAASAGLKRFRRAWARLGASEEA